MISLPKLYRSPGEWSEASGNVTGVSVTQQAVAYSTNKVNNAFFWTGSSWHLLEDRQNHNTQSISVSSGDNGPIVWGLSPGGAPVKWSGSAFEPNAGGPFTTLAATDDGGFYALYHNAIDSSDTPTLYRLGPDTQWAVKALFDGPVVQLAAKEPDKLWGVDVNGTIYKADLNPRPPAKPEWGAVPGNLSQISVGADGEIIGVGLAGDVLERRPGETRWSLLSSTTTPVQHQISAVAAGSSSDIWGIDVDGSCYQYQRATELPPPSGFPQLPIDPSEWTSILSEPTGFAPFTGVEKQVYQFFNQVIGMSFEHPNYDIRANYVSFSRFAPSVVNNLLQTNKEAATAKFGATSTVGVYEILHAELNNVHYVAEYFKILHIVLGTSKGNQDLIAQAVSATIAAEKNPPPVSFGFLDILFSILGAGLSVFLAGAGSSITDVAVKAIEGSFEVFAATTMQLVEDGSTDEDWRARNPLDATKSAIDNAILTHFTELRLGLDSKRTHILTSNCALCRAGSKINNLPPGTLSQIQEYAPQAFDKGFRLSLFQMLLPARFQIVAVRNEMADGVVQWDVGAAQQMQMWANLKEKLGKGVFDRSKNGKTYTFFLMKTDVPGLNISVNASAGTWGQTLDFASDTLLSQIFDPPMPNGGGLGVDQEDFFLGLGGWDGLVQQRATWLTGNFVTGPSDSEISWS